MTDNAHYSVLLSESVRALITEPDAIYIDGTFGRGGHSRAILGNLSDQGRLLAVDKDPQAVEVAQQLAQQDPRFNIVHGSFAELESITEQANCKKQVAGVLLDLGVSSPQLDQAERGFSFMRDGPLDMRMNTEDGVSAAQWINTAKQEELIRVFKEYGEERFAKRIASAICERREQRAFERTLDLAEVVSAANPKWERDKHPATRVFQAIRIEVNKELTDLEQVLESAISVLAPGGRIVIISFHSLEDRIVKRFFKLKSQGKQFPRDVPVTEDMLQKELRILGKAVKAGEQELDENIRSRSAVMRVAEKL